ncbi:hypothetical protein Q4S45_03795 [Massilia sp. R2A-15]|uniref:hypothetical protein n=1 Tax=Massilia sp. R2A-15 TaxID=3064278 RepID=UPI0027325ECA|nr:hypothetical protein [Massilia sp. R2A-15]WLI90258.1 hypothetical protein Q4S45_03795 [Massilia sp. R2A-15]
MRQLLLILFLGCSACTVAGPVPPAAPAVTATAAPAKGEDAATLLIRLRGMVGSASCTESSQCRTVAVGARACGGPEGYLPYSTTVTASAPLQELARRHAERRKADVAASGMLSTCEVIPDRGALCVAGTCQLRTMANDPS